MPEPAMRIVQGINPLAPALVAEGGIGDDIVKGFEIAQIGIKKEGIGQRVTLLDFRCGIVVQNHVHAGKAGGGGILFLTIERNPGGCFITHLQKERSRAAGGIVHRGVIGGGGIVNTDNSGHNAAHLGRGVELPFAFAALGGKVAHQILVGIAENIVPLCSIFGEIKHRILKNGDEVGERIDLVLAAAKLGVVVEVRHIGELVGARQRPENLFIDLVANVGFAFEGNHIPEACPLGNGYGSIEHTGIFVADIFDKKQDKHIVFILAGIHAAAQFVTTLPQGGVEFRFFEGHGLSQVLLASIEISGTALPGEGKET